MALCEGALQEIGVAMLPGSVFGRPEGEYTARLSYVDFDGAAALGASRKIALDESLGVGYLEAYCASCLEGIDRLCEWVSG